MTPSAMTTAGRSAAPRPARAPGGPGRRGPDQPPHAPRPRRVSGPVRGRAERSSPAVTGRRPSVAARGLLVIRGLPEHALLDRIVRGRVWIPLLGVLLVGIVAMQVEILKLGAGMGRWIERSSTLQTRNQALQGNVAGLMDDQRIERLAAKMGMVMPDPTALSFLSARSAGEAARAAANIHAPDPSNFAAQAPSLTSADVTGGSSSGTGANSASSSSTAASTDTASTTSADASGNTGAGTTGNSGAGATGNTGAGATGNSGAGATGNTGAGATGNSGAGATGNTGAGATGNSGASDSQSTGSSGG